MSTMFRLNITGNCSIFYSSINQRIIFAVRKFWLIKIILLEQDIKLTVPQRDLSHEAIFFFIKKALRKQKNKVNKFIYVNLERMYTKTPHNNSLECLKNS